LQIKLALNERLPEIIAQTVKPMEAIEGIKIIQVEGLGGARNSAGSGTGENAAASGSLADQAANAMLRYRAQQPVIDALLSEIGLRGGDINGLIGGAFPDSGLPSISPAPAAAAPETSATAPDAPATSQWETLKGR